MNNREIALLLSVLILLWILVSAVSILLVFSAGDLNILFVISAIFFPPFLPGGLIWMGFMAYLAYSFVGRVDKVVDPTVWEGNQRLGDPLPYRLHRLCYYYLAVVNRRFNRGVYPGFDFRQLPRELQLPLRLSGHWLCLVGISMLVVWGAIELEEMIFLSSAD